MSFKSLRVHALALTASLCLAPIGLAVAANTEADTAKNWPTKSVRIIVPAPPGAISDITARLLADQLYKNLGQTFVVENKPGGSAVIAQQSLIQAPADGYTLMVAPSSVLTDSPLVIPAPFDANDKFAYIAEASRMVHILVANEELKVGSVEEVLKKAANNEKADLSIGTHGTGMRSDMLAQQLRYETKDAIEVVPYRGSAPIINDLLGDHIQLSFEVVSNTANLINTGRLKGLAVTSASRSTHLPDVPSFAELNMSDYVLPDGSVGVFALKTTPEPLLERIKVEVDKITADSAFQEKMNAQFMEGVEPLSIAELRTKMDATIQKNRDILGKINIATVR